MISRKKIDVKKKRPNSILLVATEFPPLPGGIGDHAFNLAKHLKEKAYDVVVHTNARGERAEEFAFDNYHRLEVVRAVRSHIPIFTMWRRIYTYWRTLHHFPKEGLVLASGKFSLWMVGLFSLFYRRSYMAVLHGVDINLKQPILKRFTYWCLGRFNLLIAVSSYTREVVLRHNPKLKVQVINNGFEAQKFQTVSPPEKGGIKGIPALITVGRVHQRKGQHNVIRSLQKIRDQFPDIHYHMVGIPTDQERLEQMASDLGVRDNISFHGAVTDEELANLLTGADIFCMLSEHDQRGDFEGFGIAILEANFLGLPAIGSGNSGIADAINDGKSGVLVQPKKTEELTKALEAIMKNYAGFSKNARRWAERFKWEKVVKNYIAHINRLR